MLSRRLAYTLVALAGFLAGVFIYSMVAIIIPWVIRSLREAAFLVGYNRQLVEVVASGLIGSILSTVIAYVWATKTAPG